MSFDCSGTLRNGETIETNTGESPEDDNVMANTADVNDEAASESDVSSQISEMKEIYGIKFTGLRGVIEELKNLIKAMM